MTNKTQATNDPARWTQGRLLKEVYHLKSIQNKLVEACKISLKRLIDIAAKRGDILGNQNSGRLLDAINHLQQALKESEA